MVTLRYLIRLNCFSFSFVPAPLIPTSEDSISFFFKVMIRDKIRSKAEPDGSFVTRPEIHPLELDEYLFFMYRPYWVTQA